MNISDHHSNGLLCIKDGKNKILDTYVVLMDYLSDVPTYGAIRRLLPTFACGMCTLPIKGVLY